MAGCRRAAGSSSRDGVRSRCTWSTSVSATPSTAGHPTSSKCGCRTSWRACRGEPTRRRCWGGHSDAPARRSWRAGTDGSEDCVAHKARLVAAMTTLLAGVGVADSGQVSAAPHVLVKVVDRYDHGRIKISVNDVTRRLSYGEVKGPFEV